MSEPSRIERVAVVGCGAMGSVYAARLADAGMEVLAIGRGEHVGAMARDGLRLTGPDGEKTVRLRAFDRVPAEEMDLVILSVKAASVPEAAKSLAPLLGPETVVVTIQNGLGSADIVADEVGADRLLVGIASGFGAAVTAPGRVHHNAMRAMRFGAYAGPDGVAARSGARLDAVVRAWRRGGFDAEAVPDIAAMQWEKLICNVAYSAPCALTGLTVGEVIADPDIGPVSRAAATEAWQIAKARGIGIDVDDPVALVTDFGMRMPDAKPSALLDHQAQRPSEIGVINGAIPREAAAIGRDAPVNATLTALVRSAERAFGTADSA